MKTNFKQLNLDTALDTAELEYAALNFTYRRHPSALSGAVLAYAVRAKVLRSMHYAVIKETDALIGPRVTDSLWWLARHSIQHRVDYNADDLLDKFFLEKHFCTCENQL